MTWSNERLDCHYRAKPSRCPPIALPIGSGSSSEQRQALGVEAQRLGLLLGGRIATGPDQGVTDPRWPNYGQGSSREHAAIAPRYLGLQAAVLAVSYARIHWQNLVNFGILPLELVDEQDHGRVETGDVLRPTGLRDAVAGG